MNQSRRSVLRKASALGALAIGASATASAATDCSGVSEYDSSATYNGGDQVVYEGALWTAEWWTRGTAPESGRAVWTKEGACNSGGGGSGGGGGGGGGGGTDGGNNTDGGSGGDSSGGGTDCSGVSAYDSGATYTGGDQATYEGALWSAEWWTQGTAPATSENVWTREGDCGPANEVPMAAFSASPSNPDPGASVTFDASGSSDDGSIAAYAWDFGDGATGSGASASHTYDSVGEYVVELTVTDDAGKTASTSSSLMVGDPNELPTASFGVEPSMPAPGDSATFDASGSSDPDGSIASYEWEFGDGTTATGKTASHTYDSKGSYTVSLTVTDGDGASATTTSGVTVGTGPSDEFRVIGYYPGWKATPEYDYYPEDIPWNKVTDVQYAFLGVDAANGVPTIMSDQDRTNLETFKELKSGPASDTRITVSVGGWADSEGFSDIAASESKRQSFADRCVEILRQYDLDGVDLDWEHPGPSQGKCQCGRDKDYVNQVDLLQTMRDTLDAAAAEDGTHYSLSVANGGSDWNAGGIRHDKVGEICDHVNIMAYDFTGSWMDVVGQNAPIYGEGHPTDTTSYGTKYQNQYYVEYSVDTLWAGDLDETAFWPSQWKYPPSEPAQHDELVLGMPFYGRGFNGTEMYGSYSGLPDGTWHNLLEDGADATGSFDFGDLAANYEGVEGWEKYRNQPGEVPYIVNKQEETIISYDDEHSIEEKVKFAKERGMQGVMIWELSQDWNETLLDTVLATI